MRFNKCFLKNKGLTQNVALIATNLTVSVATGNSTLNGLHLLLYYRSIRTMSFDLSPIATSLYSHLCYSLSLQIFFNVVKHTKCKSHSSVSFSFLVSSACMFLSDYITQKREYMVWY